LLAWRDTGVFPAQYNVHLMEAMPYDPMLCFEEVAPIFDRPVGVESREYDLVPLRNGLHWLAVFEADGCPSGASQPDDSRMDPALFCAR